jgi:hypothetical protein
VSNLGVDVCAEKSFMLVTAGQVGILINLAGQVEIRINLVVRASVQTLIPPELDCWALIADLILQTIKELFDVQGRLLQGLAADRNVFLYVG